MSSTDARTSYGRCRGRALRDGCTEWRGIPYATVAQRFKRPLPPSSWEGVRECTRYAKRAWQPTLGGALRGISPLLWSAANAANLGVVQPPTNMSEESCLCLNVRSPPDFSPGQGQRRYPVMVWIHGGAFINGSGTDGIYRGNALVKKGIVLVDIQYRLGVHGFLHLDAPGCDKNCGLWDQMMVSSIKLWRSALTYILHRRCAGSKPRSAALVGTVIRSQSSAKAQAACLVVRCCAPLLRNLSFIGQF